MLHTTKSLKMAKLSLSLTILLSDMKRIQKLFYKPMEQLQEARQPEDRLYLLTTGDNQGMPLSDSRLWDRSFWQRLGADSQLYTTLWLLLINIEVCNDLEYPQILTSHTPANELSTSAAAEPANKNR